MSGMGDPEAWQGIVTDCPKGALRLFGGETIFGLAGENGFFS